ncbi:MAG TPA: hypothetical protein VE650_07460 [Acetobacteraceae bacterium]|nr:hypothetical protein [Acetobacteraceae bacterium]
MSEAQTWVPPGHFYSPIADTNKLAGPPAWFFEENRSWNETYLLRAFLMHNSLYEIQFFNSLFFAVHRREVETRMPLFLRNSGGSFWMRKRLVAAPAVT